VTHQEETRQEGQGATEQDKQVLATAQKEN